MPPRPPVRLVRLVRLCCAVALAGGCAWLGAAELGEPLVRSYSGQPLVADIELTALTDEGVVQVRPANADIYRGANIAMHAALSSMSSSVMRRDGRQYLHVTTIKPVDGDHVHVFFDLAEGGRHQVRGVTLWLAPEPVPPVRPPLPLPPPPAVAAPAAAATAAAAVVPAEAGRRAPRAHAPAACPVREPSEQAKVCAALDYKNGLLGAQIVELEEKVRLLQLAMDAKPPAPPVHAQASGPAPAATVPLKSKAMPWLPMGAGGAVLLALAGGAALMVRRRKRKGAPAAAAAAAAANTPAAAAPAAAAKVGMLGKLKALAARKKKAAPPPDAPAPD